VIRIQSQFCEHLGNDLHLPEALAFAWTIARGSNVSPEEKHEVFSFFNRVFGLGLDAEGEMVLTEAQASLIEAREEARRRNDWNTADRLRGELLAQGVHLRDGPEGPEWNIIRSKTS
jgi:cysteinyl-tRNA synthetase